MKGRLAVCGAAFLCQSHRYKNWFCLFVGSYLCANIGLVTDSRRFDSVSRSLTVMNPQLRLSHFGALAVLFAFALHTVGCRPAASSDPGPTSVSVTAAPYIHANNPVEAGRYLVLVGGCNDCHTPGFLENGLSVPEAQWLTGLPIGFRGPWGTSYPVNLRLSVAQYPEDAWVNMLHTRHTLPPMPWHAVNSMSEQDVRALYAYITSLGEGGMPAPQAVPPGEEPTTPYFDFVPQHMERLSAPTDSVAQG